MWKDFFYFSRSEKQGIIVLTVLICMVILGGEILSIYKRSQEPVCPGDIEEEYAQFLTSLKREDSIMNVARQSRTDYHTSNPKEQVVALVPFDPNTTDSITFRQMGLPAWMTGNILRYRKKGGKFRIPEDFRKIYGLTEEQYNTLRPYIYISEEYRKRDTIRALAEQHIPLKRDSLKPFKYPPGTVIDLNSADTTELKKIPGIGSAYAKRIVGYRKRLGGFYNVSQLQEIELDAETLAQWLNVESEATTRINLNKVGIERLKAHPYFNFYQAKVVIEYRKKRGNLKRLEQLAFFEEFTKEDVERIKHYVCFE